MRLSWNVSASRRSLYEAFEHVVMFILTCVLVLLVAFATWKLIAEVTFYIVNNRIDPENSAVFQSLFGMIFTVVIGLEFKRSLLVVSDGKDSVVRVRSIILIGMLATVRKFIVLDLTTVVASELFAVSAAILALGIVYWLVRDQDRKANTSKFVFDPHEG